MLKNKTKTERLVLIDLMRFFAAFSVLIYHFAYKHSLTDDLTTASLPAFQSIFKYGFLGVDLFFLISGFVIFQSIHHGDINRFIFSRLKRLYPAYWFCVTFTCIIMLIAGNNIDFSVFIINLSMLQEFINIEHIDGVYWSLTIELIFYFWMALLLLKGNQENFENYTLLFLGLYLLNLFVPLPYKIQTLIIAQWGAYFIAGAIFFKCYQSGFTIKRILILIICLILSWINANKYIAKLSLHFNDEFNLLYVCTVISVFYILFMVISLKLTNAFKCYGAITLGSLTYPLYLLHQNIGYILLNYFSPMLGDTANLLIVTLITLFLAWIVATFIEIPMANKIFSNKLRYKLNFQSK